MSDRLPDGSDDVVGLITDQIESRFGMGMEELEAAVAAAPAANPDATDVVKWRGLLVESQESLDRAERDLLAALETQPSESEVDDSATSLAERVNMAVTTRDNRALMVRWLLDPGGPGKKDFAAERIARLRRGASPRGAAVPTSAPYRLPSAPAPASAPRTRRGM